MLKESSIFGGPAILPAGKKQCYEAGACAVRVHVRAVPVGTG